MISSKDTSKSLFIQRGCLNVIKEVNGNPDESNKL
jgi:hypothetical protein